MIEIKTEAEIAKMREAGLVVGQTLELLRSAAQPGVSTGELDAIAEQHIRDSGAVPSFKGYQGFPASICASINDEIVHGIPDRFRVLRDGDIISLDCGAIVDGWHGDAAITVPVGAVAPELHRLLAVCEEALWQGIGAARLGGRLTDISHAIEIFIRAQGRYGIVEEYGGHGIGSRMHQDPHLLNYGRPGRGPRLVKGMALAVEPMINIGSRKTKVLGDDWTVVTEDGSCSAHFEHTFTLTEDGPWVLTALDGGTARLGRDAAAVSS
ncbi:MAG: type I methionyl aminopeptidase [Sporichthyaceae bacterium]|nr:type I methionyl aminopeptidase [Sporichthyaceae bacterium]